MREWLLLCLSAWIVQGSLADIVLAPVVVGTVGGGEVDTQRYKVWWSTSSSEQVGVVEFDLQGLSFPADRAILSVQFDQMFLNPDDNWVVVGWMIHEQGDGVLTTGDWLPQPSDPDKWFAVYNTSDPVLLDVTEAVNTARAEGWAYICFVAGSRRIFDSCTYVLMAATIGPPAEENAFDNFSLTIKLDTCPADLNQDGTVDMVDLAILLANYGASDDVTPDDGDIDHDGDIDLSDLSALLAVYGTTCG